jgi:hypothetical protein
LLSLSGSARDRGKKARGGGFFLTLRGFIYDFARDNFDTKEPSGTNQHGSVTVTAPTDVFPITVVAHSFTRDGIKP